MVQELGWATARLEEQPAGRPTGSRSRIRQRRRWSVRRKVDRETVIIGLEPSTWQSLSRDPIRAFRKPDDGSTTPRILSAGRANGRGAACCCWVPVL